MIIDYTARLKAITKNKSASESKEEANTQIEIKPEQDTQTKLKIYYNKLIERYKKAEKFMDDGRINIDLKMKCIPELQQIMRELTEMLSVIENYTDEEALEGFSFNCNNELSKTS